jgi:hypothetical protein
MLLGPVAMMRMLMPMLVLVLVLVPVLMLVLIVRGGCGGEGVAGCMGSN